MVWINAGFWGLLICGILVGALGWRGRRRGQTPHCRRCGYNLTGTVDTADACPECGNPLGTPRSVVVGLRRRRPVLMIAGLLLAIIGGVAVVQRHRGMDMLPYVPDIVLAMMLDDPDTREALIDRLDADELGAWSTRRAVAIALDAQGDRARPWDRDWGEIVALAYAAGHVTPKQARRFAEQACALHIDMRPRVMLGWVPEAEVGTVDDSSRTGPEARVDVTLVATRMQIDGQDVSLDSLPPVTARGVFKSWGEYTFDAIDLPTDRISDSLGTRRVTIEIKPTYTLTFDQTSLEPFTGEPISLAAEIEVVAEPTGNYTFEPPESLTHDCRLLLRRGTNDADHQFVIVRHRPMGEGPRLVVSPFALLTLAKGEIRWTMDSGGIGKGFGGAVGGRTMITSE